MTRTVYCQKLGKPSEALGTPPYPGELGKRIYEHISAQAWQLWIQRQTMLINEYRLNLTEIKTRKFLEQEMEKFLFGGETPPPPGYIPEDKS